MSKENGTRPVRKSIRLKTYDYSTAGAYFVTVCAQNREPLFWTAVGADIIRPQGLPLSEEGKIVRQSILQIPNRYETVFVDAYCVMPDHVHLIVCMGRDESGRMISAPTLSTVIGSMKRWASRQIGRSIWQKSFYDHAIRNQQDYEDVWEYIANNPLKYAEKNGMLQKQ